MLKMVLQDEVLQFYPSIPIKDFIAQLYRVIEQIKWSTQDKNTILGI